MAYCVPAAVVAAVVNGRPHKNPNFWREPYSSEEDISAAIRLRVAEVQLLSPQPPRQNQRSFSIYTMWLSSLPVLLTDS